MSPINATLLPFNGIDAFIAQLDQFLSASLKELCLYLHFPIRFLPFQCSLEHIVLPFKFIHIYLNVLSVNINRRSILIDLYQMGFRKQLPFLEGWLLSKRGLKSWVLLDDHVLTTDLRKNGKVFLTLDAGFAYLSIWPRLLFHVGCSHENVIFVWWWRLIQTFLTLIVLISTLIVR